MNCTNCGAGVNPGQPCPNCGTLAADAPSSAPGNEPPGPYPQGPAAPGNYGQQAPYPQVPAGPGGYGQVPPPGYGPSAGPPPPGPPGYAQPGFPQQGQGLPQYQAQSYGAGPGTAPYGYQGGGLAKPKTNGMAIASLVCSIAGLFTLGLGGLLGIIFASVALRQIKRTGARGRGLAIAGLVVGIIMLLLGIVDVVLIINGSAKSTHS